MSDRFELEQAIHNCWNTKEDINLLLENIDDDLPEDEVRNALIGIIQLHEMRSKKLFYIFEDLIANGKVN